MSSEHDIMPDQSRNPFSKRTNKQRDADREFIKEFLAHDNNVKKITIYEELHKEIKRREGDNAYTLEYGYVCTEVERVRKITNASRVDLQSHIDKSLDLIYDNIAICVDEIRIRMTERENYFREKITLKVEDMKKLSVEEIAIINRLGNKIYTEREVTRKIRAGQDVRDMMEILHKWIQAKRELLGEDAPKKISQRIDLDIVIQQQSPETLEREILDLGYGVETVELIKQAVIKNEKK